MTPQERANVANHKYTILHRGKLLPVTDIFGMDGQTVASPLHAFRCVVYDDVGAERKGFWLLIECHPGDVLPRRF